MFRVDLTSLFFMLICLVGYCSSNVYSMIIFGKENHGLILPFSKKKLIIRHSELDNVIVDIES